MSRNWLENLNSLVFRVGTAAASLAFNILENARPWLSAALLLYEIKHVYQFEKVQHPKTRNLGQYATQSQLTTKYKIKN